jgi:hypothetical protein
MRRTEYLGQNDLATAERAGCPGLFKGGWCNNFFQCWLAQGFHI